MLTRTSPLQPSDILSPRIPGRQSLQAAGQTLRQLRAQHQHPRDKDAEQNAGGEGLHRQHLLDSPHSDYESLPQLLRYALCEVCK